jgi:hypothetical protein
MDPVGPRIPPRGTTARQAAELAVEVRRLGRAILVELERLLARLYR